MADGNVNVPGASAADLKKVEKKADAAKTVAAEAMDAVQKFAFTINTVPSQAGSLTYTGSQQTPAWNGYNPEMLELSGVTEGINAGEYGAIFTPLGDYVWADGTQDPVTVHWTIERAAINTTPSQSGTKTYTGAAQSPSWSNYDSAKLTIGGTTSATNAGTYSATFTPGANYKWADGTTAARTVNWTIERAVITTTPSQSGTVTYNGAAQSPSWSNYDSTKLTIGGTTSATNAGTYSATFTPGANYKWSDGTTTAKSANWTIGKAAGSLSLNKSSMTLNKATTASTIAVTRAGDGAVTATSSNTSVATVSVSGTTVTVTGKVFGTATITIKVAAGTNHNAPANKTCTVQVNIFNSTLNSNTWAAIKAASDAGEAANCWSVGATKTITINGKIGNTTISSLSIDAFIIGFNHNSAREGSNRVHFQIGKIGGNLVGLVDSNYNSSGSDAKNFQMNASNTNSGGWSGSSMRKTLLGNSNTPTNPLANSFMAALPSDLRAVMKSVTKYSDNTGGGSDTASYVTATTDYLFLLAEFEYHGARSYANSAEKNFQAQYDYYKAGNTKVHNKHNATSTAAIAWCRSVYASGTDYFCRVSTSGNARYTTAYTSYALAPGFCV